MQVCYPFQGLTFSLAIILIAHMDTPNPLYISSIHGIPFR